VLRIRLGLNVDPDQGNQTNADPDLDPGQTLPSQEVEVLHEKYWYLILYVGTVPMVIGYRTVTA
jgi:hypothetical protein